MITMVLGGLWHGASWNFVIWGALHGVGLAVTRMWQRARGGRGHTRFGSMWRVSATFHFVCFAWIFFRAPTLGHACLMIERISRGTLGTANLGPKVETLIVLALGLHWVPKRWVDLARELFVRTPAPVQGIVLAAAAYGLHLAAGAKAEPFVYGQF
jgi:hypothetical protein